MNPALPMDIQSNALPPSPVTTMAAMRKPDVDQERIDRERNILREAQEFFRTVTSYEAEWRRNAQEEFDFLALDHWPDHLKQERNGRPCLVFDRIGPVIDMVVNDASQSPPEPKISPVGNGADKKTAEVLQGLIRNIENDSQAEQAYMGGYEHAVAVGRGWWRILAEYESDFIPDPESDSLPGDLMRQKLKIAAVPNPFSIYPDPASQKPDGSDMRRLIATENLDRDAYNDEYPDSNVRGMSDFESVGDHIRTAWFPNGAVRVAEYWKVEETHVNVVQLEGGRVVKADQAYDGKIIASRRVAIRSVKCYKLNGVEILEEYTWPGKWIPFIPCTGKRIIKKTKTLLRGMVRPTMDANLSYDFMRSKQSEAVGLAPIAPWMVAEGSIEGHEQLYADSNRKAIAVLPYKVEVNGRPVPPPTRVTAEPNIQAITIAVQHADNDVKATSSTYDASLGNAGPESSGRAILARQREADNAHYHYHRNLGWSIQQTGRMLVDLFPHYYNAEQTISIVDPDGSVRAVDINRPTWAEGVQRVFALGDKAARYDVTVGSGPSFATRRQEGSAALLELTRTMPGIMGRVMDLVMKFMDIPGAQEFAERLRPADIQVQQDDGAPPIPPAVQMKLAQYEQMMPQLMQALQRAQDETERVRMMLASKERIVDTQERTKAALGLAKLNSAEAIEQLRAEIQTLLARIGQIDSSPEAVPQQQPNDAQPAPDASGAQPPPVEIPSSASNPAPMMPGAPSTPAAEMAPQPAASGQ